MPLVTDTHALVWHMTEDSQLSKRAKRAFEKADASDDYIVVPCIIFFELLYLIEKKEEKKEQFAVDFDRFIAMVSLSENYKIEPLCLPIIEQCKNIPRKKVKDPWDRLIGATSIHLNFPLITGDKKLRKALRRVDVDIVW